MRTKLLAALTACAIATAAHAKIQTKDVEYKQGDTVLRGFLAWDDQSKEKRPGVLIVHEWWGLNQHARNQAVRVAKAGYVGFAIDMYGDGKVTTHPKDAQAFMQQATKDPAVMTARFDAALDLLKKQPQVDPDKIAAFGYCFGGGVALNMARAGADLDAVVTFHGSLKPFDGPAKPGSVKPALLVLAGEADPMVTKDQVQAFEEEMKAAGARFEVITYPNAKHAFTNPDAGKFGVPGLEYNAAADKASWKAATQFLKKVFAT
jgi:dienelactone hydrolase